MFGVDDYPWKHSPCGANNPQNCNYSIRDCTDFAMWRLRRDMGIGCLLLGSAHDWSDRAADLGYAVDFKPEMYDVIQFAPGEQGASSAGHLAVVIGIGPGFEVLCEQYNYLPCAYSQRRFYVNDRTYCIHFLERSLSPPPTEPNYMPRLNFFVAKTVTGINAVFVADGIHFRHVRNATNYADLQNTGPWFNGDGDPMLLWANGSPVGDVYAFGVPADAETASLLGLPLP